MKEGMEVNLTVNERPVKHYISRKRTLLEFIREDLGLTGAKEGCGTGDCGSCVVLVNGRARRSCHIPAYKADGAKILTIEGLAKGGNLSYIQEAFVESGAIQCGFCTPGMVLEAKALLEKNPEPTEDEIKEAISGHICRCTGYIKIIEAVRKASGNA
jgi:carbon-monoxide dehydrogenase small subunit